MSKTSHQPINESDARDEQPDDYISGPHYEPHDQGGARYWRCIGCGRESLRSFDLERPAFHPEGCPCAELLIEQASTEHTEVL